MAKRLPGERIFGVETEFGTLINDDLLGTPEEAVELIKDYLFLNAKLGALDIHARDDVFEPAQSGGFLLNGGRLYIDAVGSHLEYATAECRTLKDLVANDRAGQRQIVRALRELGLADAVDIYNNSVDHFGGHTFGCHENYLVQASEDLFQRRLQLLYPFLVTRQIFAGVGRVGGHILSGGARPNYDEIMAHPIDYVWVSNVYRVDPDDSVVYQLSQRADHILKTVASRVRFNRALINPKWEHYYSYDGNTRLHLLFGEPNQNEYAYALKVGTTSIVLRLLEEDRVSENLALANPIGALRSVSRDASYKWLVGLSDGSTISAIDLQREYLSAAQIYLGEHAQSDWVLREWERTLNDLAEDPMAMADRIDWVCKKTILDDYCRQENLEWNDSALHSVDLEYHNIDPDKSLYGAYAATEKVERVTTEIDIIDAMTEPPQNTRALGRSKLVKEVLSKKSRRAYAFDWNCVILDRNKFYDLQDPFDTYEGVSEQDPKP